MYQNVGCESRKSGLGVSGWQIYNVDTAEEEDDKKNIDGL